MTKDNLTTNASNEAENPAFLVGAVIGSFYKDDFGFESIDFENTQDGTILIRCDSPEDLVTFEMSKERAIKMALAILKNCL
jgi:hypothetical protein